MLVARWPGYIKQGSETTALVQIADVLPTFIEAAGGRVAAQSLDGRSFLPVLMGKVTKHRDYVYGLHHNVPEGKPYPIRSICDGQYHYLWNLQNKNAYHEKHIMVANSRLVWWPALVRAAEQSDRRAVFLMDSFRHRPVEELYQVTNDPHECQNLASDPAHEQVRLRLRQALEAWMTDQKDPGSVLDSPEAFDKNQKGR
jgi:N-sulfoglucosamine sulfohydrolase